MILVVFAGVSGFALGIATPLLEILAGIVGVNFFGLETSGIIDLLGEMGILSLMYLAGLEINMEFIKKEYKSSIGVGAASFLAPFLAVFVICNFLLGFELMASLLIATALSTTSVAIVYPILLGQGMNKINKTLLAAAMVTDLLSIIALSMFFSDFTVYTLLVLLGLLVFSKPIRDFGHVIFSKITKSKKQSMGLKLKIVLLILLGLQVTAEFAGVEAVLLAFLFGIFTSELIEKFETIESQLKTITFAFLTPFFFFKVGLSIDLVSLWNSVGYLALFTAIVYGSKWLGTYLATKPFFPKKGHYAGHLFNSQLSIGIIAATLGLEAQILTAEIYVAIVGAVILCSLISSIATHEKFTLEG